MNTYSSIERVCVCVCVFQNIPEGSLRGAWIQGSGKNQAQKWLLSVLLQAGDKCRNSKVIVAGYSVELQISGFNWDDILGEWRQYTHFSCTVFQV